jgi:hypothetical protein
MAHEKLKSLAVGMIIFAIVGAVCWAFVSTQTSHHKVQPETQAAPELAQQQKGNRATTVYVCSRLLEILENTNNLLFSFQSC